MKLIGIRTRVISLCIVLVVCCVRAESSNDLLLRKRVAWEAGTAPRGWEAVIDSPNGTEHFRLALLPLWAVEGGIVAIEILIASSEQPDDNLLGRRENDGPSPFVITVEELESGINKSQFGAKRVFNVRRAKLRVKILGSELGRGVGDCESCKNIQKFTAELSLWGK